MKKFVSEQGTEENIWTDVEKNMGREKYIMRSFTIFCTLFYDTFSVTRLYSVDERVANE
jgi:hypothetical protein